MKEKGKIGRCCRHCYDGENDYPEYCNCLCHEDMKASANEEKGIIYSDDTDDDKRYSPEAQKAGCYDEEVEA